MKVFRLVFGIFGVVGLILLTIGVVSLYNTYQWLQTTEQTKGNVIELRHIRSSDGGLLYKPVVEYRDQNANTHILVSNTASYPAPYEIGEEVAVLYQKNQAEKAKIKAFFSLWGFSVIFGGIGLVFTSMGIILAFYLVRQHRRKKWLELHGRFISSTLKQASIDFSTMINGQHPYRIFSQWKAPDSRKVYVFKSPEIWFDPSEFLTENQEIKVRINPKNPKIYLMDLSFLPKLN